ncbi:TetR/AcrR family transcriptional regulator [Frankia sp. CNm7]|uniref:TetR/AcrR family transcriptional regulator n=1 Tax=Frankia nepalensis TaxID=1836974 RepID=A0A937RI32_9ACTN|nr:TetR family transcriptional regulator [Frankia nepalensis]MBL7502069.1 TetR/AcrR family transcriptional regulator [Frankia nepalensis]MBL7511803.1 TetR/AcrR family transcriptional regulator [Frankia nepalensis]MBL7524656.1 TetR/AcrR family transcriptional regulator [Frankia nepalensis]MBL7630567.1 TetR/AcrR family transcriptional regulator [Frankia nepalensis]
MTGAPEATWTGEDSGQRIEELAATQRWSPNQQAARSRLALAAARLVARSGPTACTIRAVAEEAGLTKSTVHYYVDDADELVDLAVLTYLRQFAAQTRRGCDEAPDGPEALCVLVRTFLGRGARTIQLGEAVWLHNPIIWSAYLTHAWPRGARAALLACFETFRELFEATLARCGVDDPAEQARALHLYLLGVVQLNIVQPLPQAEVARAVTALTGVPVAPARC